jgi:predicted PhzF superfamily epimerase YddE/YHI9
MLTSADNPESARMRLFFLPLIGLIVDPSTGALEAELYTSADYEHDHFMLDLRPKTSGSLL